MNILSLQIWQQFPCSFEYNEDFLIMLFKHAYASQFGELVMFIWFKHNEVCVAAWSITIAAYS